METGRESFPILPRPASKLIKKYNSGGKPIAIHTLTLYCQKNRLKLDFQKTGTVKKKKKKGRPQSWEYGCQCFIDGTAYPEGVGPSEKTAKRDAAFNAFTVILEAQPDFYQDKTQNSENMFEIKTRSKARYEKLDREDISVLYSPPVIENTSSQLKEIVDEKKGMGWKRLKWKCGMSSEDTGEEKGWGYASHFFSFSGLPEEYLDEFYADLSLSDFESYAETKSNFRKPIKSGPTATVTLAEISGKEAINDNDDPKHEEANKSAINMEIKNSAASNTHDCEDLTTDNREKCDSDNSTTDEVKLVPVEKKGNEPCLHVEISLGLEGNKHSDINSPQLKDQLINVAHTLKRKRDVLESETGEIFVTFEVGEKLSDSKSTGDIKENVGKTTPKKPRIEECEIEAINHETIDLDEIDNGSSEMQKPKAVEYIGDNLAYDPRENLIDNLDKDVDTGVVMSTYKGDIYKFKCDFCPAISSYETKILKHLEEAVHYSASLVSVDANGSPENTVWQCIFTHEPASFKTVVAVCPHWNCPGVFRHMYACAAHYNIYHKPDEGPTYSLAEVIKGEIVTEQHLFKECKVCLEHFSDRQDLAKHIKDENHLPFTQEEGVTMIFFCTFCEKCFYNFFQALNHGQIKKKSHIGDIRVLQISLDRVKKTILPYKLTPEMDIALIDSEIKNLKELKKHAGKQMKKRIRGNIQELKRLKADPKGAKQHFDGNWKWSMKREKKKTTPEQDYAHFIVTL